MGLELIYCMSDAQMLYFIEVTGMKVVAAIPESIILQGETLFKYMFDYSTRAFCLVDPKTYLTP